jgi:hypothetical protein
MVPMNEAPLPAALSGYPEPFADADLDLAFGGSEAREVPAWKPTDDAAADWAMRKLAETVHQARPVNEQAKAWRERIDQWERRELAALEHRVRFFMDLLEAYGLEQRAASGGQRKTINLPAGSIATRGSEDERLVVDKVAFLTCMTTAPPMIREALTRSEPKPVTELRRLVHRYRRVVCKDCGGIIVRREGDYNGCPDCGGEVDTLETFLGIPMFGLADADTMGTGVFRLEGLSFEPPAAPSATVRLADERALPRTSPREVRQAGAGTVGP